MGFLVRCLHLLPILGLWLVLEWSTLIDEGDALEWWAAFLLLHFGVGIGICVFELWRLSTKLNEYPYGGPKHGGPKRKRQDTEGYQSFLMIVVSIHGIASVAGATISYFVVASFFNQKLQSYIFLNNEGAIAAITLIIVIMSAAVVAVYVELAKSVRQEIDAYEVGISMLNQTLVEINDHAEQVWKHFDSVARTMLAEWKKVLEENKSLLSIARIKDLDRPLNLMAFFQEFLGQDFYDIDDREFWKYDDRTERECDAPNQNVNDKYEKIEDLEHSRVRYRDSMNLTDRPEEIGKNDRMTATDQRRRARRLRYLGWEHSKFIGLSGVIETLSISNGWNEAIRPLENAARHLATNPEDCVPVGQKSRIFLNWLVDSSLLGDDAMDQPRTDENLLKAVITGTRKLRISDFKDSLRKRLNTDSSFRERFTTFFSGAINDQGFADWARTFENVTPTPSDDYNTFAPAHEKSLVYVMRLLSELGKNDRSNNGDATNNFIDFSINDFDRRVRDAHIHRTVSLEARRIEGGLVATLNRLCATFDLDPSVFTDDLDVFNHLGGLARLRPTAHDESTAGKNISGDYKELSDLYRYAAYSRFVYYAFWLIDGPERIHSLLGEPFNPNSVSSLKIMDDLKKVIDETTECKAPKNDTSTEFLLLMLADQRSALFNWLRSARARTVRKTLSDYEKILDDQQKGLTRHFGIEVIPARHTRLSELQNYLKVGDQAQKPIRLTSVYDLVPRQSVKATKRNPSYTIYTRYVDTYRFISFSRNWEETVTIHTATIQSVFAWLHNRTDKLGVELGDKQTYVSWLVNKVFPMNQDLRLSRKGRPAETDTLKGDALLLVRALWLVSPTFKAMFDGSPIPSIGDMSEVEQYLAVRREISRYCLDSQNEEDIKDTFFGGQNPASAHTAVPRYWAWRKLFEQRAIR